MGATFCYIAAYSRRTFKSNYFNVLSLKSWPSCMCGVCTCLDTDNKVCGAFVATFLRFLAANATTTADASAESVALQKASKCPKMSKVKSSQGRSRPNCWDHFRIFPHSYWMLLAALIILASSDRPMWLWWTLRCSIWRLQTLRHKSIQIVHWTCWDSLTPWHQFHEPGSK
jgi:hypothetical protein